MKITAEEVKCEDLKPGDLFSTAGQSYWSHYEPFSVGERVYIRTERACPPNDRGKPIFKITIDKED